MPAALAWALFVAYLGLTFLLSSLSSVPGASSVPDYFLHTAEFVTMTLLLVNAISGGVLRPHPQRVLVGAFVFGAGYGILDEVHQSFVSGRDASVRDAVVDIAASAMAALAIGIVGRFRSAGRPGGGAGSSRRSASETPRVEMIGGAGCHLCEEVRRRLVETLGPEGGAWRERDVASDAELMTLYGLEIPVVLVDGVKRFKGRVEPARLIALLSDRGRLRGN